MEVVLIIVIGLGVLWALVSGTIAIVDSWRYCVAMGSAKPFFSNAVRGIGGNWIAVFGIVLLCLPVWLLLSIVISSKRRQPHYLIQLRFTTDKRYDGVMEVYDGERERSQSPQSASEKAIDYLVNNGVSRQEAEESIGFYSLVQTISKK